MFTEYIQTFNALPEPLLFSLVFFVFLAIGSWLNVVIFRTVSQSEYDSCQYVVDEYGDCEEAARRLKELTRVDSKRSVCTHCNTQLKAYHNIPLISYICLLGKCCFCKKSISPQYPLIEFLSAFLPTITLIYHFGGEITSEYLVLIPILLVSLVICAIDIRETVIFDIHSTLYVILSMLLMSILPTISLDVVFVEATMYFFCFFLFVYIFSYIRSLIVGANQQVMGGGDYPLIFVLILWLSGLSIVDDGGLIIKSMMVCIGAFTCTAFVKRAIEGDWVREIPAAPSIIATTIYVLVIYL
ncbi:putative Leader peptidase / N-methyltransferase [Vibrio chagasii]|nr:putative Leader peptidase / N-methyltransferase [Vibrio chagasii]